MTVWAGADPQKVHVLRLPGREVLARLVNTQAHRGPSHAMRFGAGRAVSTAAALFRTQATLRLPQRFPVLAGIFHRHPASGPDQHVFL
jgi:hypothetical protein